jgi:hypothetical protein
VGRLVRVGIENQVGRHRNFFISYGPQEQLRGLHLLEALDEIATQRQGIRARAGEPTRATVYPRPRAHILRDQVEEGWACQPTV